MTDYARAAAERLYPTDGDGMPGQAAEIFKWHREEAVKIIQAAIDLAISERSQAAGRIGGNARAKKLSKKRRVAIARQGAMKRWGKQT